MQTNHSANLPTAPGCPIHPAMVSTGQDLPGFKVTRATEQELGRVQSQTHSTPMVYAGPPPDFPRSGIPAGAMDIAIAFFITCAVIVVGWPISRALGRRVERRGAGPVLEGGMTDQLQRIEQAVEAMAIEIERISESQRYLTKIQGKSASTIE